MSLVSNRAQTWTDGVHEISGTMPENLVARHILFSLLVIIFYFVLNAPEIILVSPDLGFTAWYPAVGLVLAVMLCVSPRYLPLLIFADTLAGVAIYHQPLLSWNEGVGPLVASGSYALAAYLLRGPFKIDSALRHRRDVVRYVAVVGAAALIATLGGVTCLIQDHTIERSQFWASAVQWFMGDMVGLVGFAPFLLIHAFPWIQRQLGIAPAVTVPRTPPETRNQKRHIRETAEALAQACAIATAIWIMLGETFGHNQFYFLAFVPIIWIAMRNGIKRVATALVLFNFGIVLALRIFPRPVDFQVRLGLLMLAVSATGLIVGSEVTERKRITRQLGERTGFLNSLIEQNPLAIAVRDHTGKVQFCNDALSDLFLYVREEIVGRDLDSLIGLPGGDATGTGPAVSSRRTVRKARKDKTVLDLELHEVALEIDGTHSVSYAIYRDISDQVKSAREAAEYAESLDKLVTELQLRTVEMSQLNDMVGLLQCCASGAEAASIVAQSAKNILSPATGGGLFLFNAAKDTLSAVSSWGHPLSTEPKFSGLGCWALRRGQAYWSQYPNEGVFCSHLLDPVEASYLCVPMVAQGETLGIVHIQYNRNEPAKSSEAFESFLQSQQRLAVAVAGQVALSLASLRLRETLREQSIRDPLTGLFNRRFMTESLDRELVRAKRRQHPLSVLFLDLDHFKEFNDTFGHDAGDEVLRAVAEQLRISFRADDVVCRYGGEEFAILLPEANSCEAAKRAEKLCESIRQLRVFHREQALGIITISVGIAGFPDHASTAVDLLRLADLGLYRAKSEGRNRVNVAARPTLTV